MIDASQAKIFDLLVTKSWAIRYATDAALTVLRVDQVCFLWITYDHATFFFFENNIN